MARIQIPKGPEELIELAERINAKQNPIPPLATPGPLAGLADWPKGGGDKAVPPRRRAERALAGAR